jgi:hypothetical protein
MGKNKFVYLYIWIIFVSEIRTIWIYRSCKLMMILATRYNFRFRFIQDPLSYFCSFHTPTFLEMDPPSSTRAGGLSTGHYPSTGRVSSLYFALPGQYGCFSGRQIYSRSISVQYSVLIHKIQVPQHLSQATNKRTNKLRGFSPQVNYIDRATAACRRS